MFHFVSLVFFSMVENEAEPIGLSINTSPQAKEQTAHINEKDHVEMNIAENMDNGEQCSMYYDIDDGGYNSFMMEIHDDFIANCTSDSKGRDSREAKYIELDEKLRSVLNYNRDNNSAVETRKELKSPDEDAISTNQQSHLLNERPSIETVVSTNGSHKHVTDASEFLENNSTVIHDVSRGASGPFYNDSFLAFDDLHNDSFLTHCMQDISTPLRKGSRCVELSKVVSMECKNVAETSLNLKLHTQELSDYKTPANLKKTEKGLEACKHFGPGCSVHPETNEAITPMPDYSILPTPELRVGFNDYVCCCSVTRELLRERQLTSEC